MSEKLNKIYNLLSEHKFTIISEINEDLKCVICKEILVNAQQSLCGCHFCQICIKKYQNSGSKNCPGNTDECKSENLSNIFPDPGTNKRISNLIARCPHESCSHECRLIEMEDHMRFCSTRNVNCPFNNVGCEHEEMNIDKLNDHMLLEIVNHNKILIDIIGNLRNDVRELKEKEERNRKEIEILKANDCKKDEKLELLMKEINLIKSEKEDLADQMEICDRNLWNSFDKIDKEMKDKCTNDVIKSINDEMKLLKMEKEELSQQIGNLKGNFDDKFNVEMNARLTELDKEWSERFDIQTTERNEINKYLNMRDDGELWWQIGKISEIDCMMGGFFYDKQNPYKMRLVLGNRNDEFIIGLMIDSGPFDADLKWPCRANIIIMIYSFDKKFNPRFIKKFITISINKPESESENSSENESSDSKSESKNSSESESEIDLECDSEEESSKEMIKFSHSYLMESKHFKRNCLLYCKVIFD